MEREGVGVGHIMMKVVVAVVVVAYFICLHHCEVVLGPWRVKWKECMEEMSRWEGCDRGELDRVSFVASADECSLREGRGESRWDVRKGVWRGG